MSAPANGRPVARPVPEVPAQRDTGRVAASLERIAGLHHELAGAYHELSRDLPDALADVRDPRLMDVVPTATPGPDLLTVADLAERLRVSEKTVRTWRSEGVLPAPIEIGGVIRWRAAEFEEWLAGQGS